MSETVAEPYTAQDVADFLNTGDRTSAVPVAVRIGRTTYVGASYGQTRDVTPGCRAYDDGQRTYVQSGYYLLGALPASWMRDRRTVYADGATGTYYVSCWYGQEGDQHNQWHPFGSMFQLFRDPGEWSDGRRVRPMIVRAV